MKRALTAQLLVMTTGTTAAVTLAVVLLKTLPGLSGERSIIEWALVATLVATNLVSGLFAAKSNLKMTASVEEEFKDETKRLRAESQHLLEAFNDLRERTAADHQLIALIVGQKASTEKGVRWLDASSPEIRLEMDPLVPDKARVRIQEHFDKTFRRS